MSAFDRLLAGLTKGRDWELMGDSDKVRQLLSEVYDERCQMGRHHKDAYQVRVNLQKADGSASYAGWITADNEKSGPYQGTSFVWLPGANGSVAVLVIGTDGFGADTGILGRPGHARRLRALSRLHKGRVWVKPDLLEISTDVPDATSKQWPDIAAALKSYTRVIYAATAVRDAHDGEAVADLLDLFFHEHHTPLTGSFKTRWEQREAAIAGAVFPALAEDDTLATLRERRFVILDGPPGTGKTRLENRLADRVGSATKVQFHAARTYEDFVLGLFPRPTGQGLAFEVRAGDLIAANKVAQTREHVLVIDEINRADLARVLGEAISLFEVGEADRSVRIPHPIDGDQHELRLSPHLMVLGTRNTADRTIARLDIAIRRRFAFVDVWPDLSAVQAESLDFASDVFTDVLQTFAEYADDDTLRLVPGHAYVLDPRPDLEPEGRLKRVARRVRYELVPLLRHYLDEKLCGAASEHVAALTDRTEARLMAL